MDRILQLLLLIGGSVAAYFAWSKSASAATYQSTNEFPAGDSIIGYATVVDDAGNILDYQPVYYSQYTGSMLSEEENAEPGVIPPIDPATNLNAFLTVIRQLESGENYYIGNGGFTFTETRDHPANPVKTGGLDWRGNPANGSTAAGAYQINKGTWNDYRFKWQIPDFSPVSQDAFAIGLIQQRGGMPFIESGDFDGAAKKLAGTWDVFRTVPVADARSIFMNNGGMLA